MAYEAMFATQRCTRIEEEEDAIAAYRGGAHDGSHHRAAPATKVHRGREGSHLRRDLREGGL
jgi:hypothetical protein